MDNLKKSHARHTDNDALKEMQDMMLHDYQEACDANGKNNDKKAKYVWRMKLFMIISLSALFITFAPYVYLRATQPIENIQKVEIVDKK